MGLLEKPFQTPPCQIDCKKYTAYKNREINYIQFNTLCKDCKRLTKGNIAAYAEALEVEIVEFKIIKESLEAEIKKLKEQLEDKEPKEHKQVAPTKPRGSSIDKKYGTAIVNMSARGMSNREIAEELGISRNSVNKFNPKAQREMLQSFKDVDTKKNK